MRKDLETTIAFYDKQYADSTVSLDMQKFYDQFEKYLPEGACVLDAGCGSGRDSKYFLEQGYSVTAFDASETMCECASKLIGQDVRHLTFQEMDYQECFDGIWACASLLHVPEEELAAVLRQIANALKSGGVLYASWKYGEKDRFDVTTDRFFCDMKEKKLRKIMKDLMVLELCDVWLTSDVRNEYSTQNWINVLAKKI